MRLDIVLTIELKRDPFPLGTQKNIGNDERDEISSGRDEIKQMLLKNSMNLTNSRKEEGDNTSSGHDEVLRAIRKNALEFTNSLPKGQRWMIKDKTNAIKNARGETIDHET